MNVKKLSLAGLTIAALLAASAANATTVTFGNSGLVYSAYSQTFDAAAASVPGSPVTTSGSPIVGLPY